ncbi:N-acetylmuramoyl-L-alanine amidase [Maledivibacter halophilus]|uniref:N-acetylmuramoyl-L-alanine amidase n=1 Tax=Maledivibacter halophilus TaxID=36842 RepID=A0A1T5LXA0_9FIRM|nr:N-acetylmuramoyl-L-alanine amidase [Maledivibacter halophilus]SKC68477.1 N-acetylmuramoyl-L-alanine amidase [Maledivibacter halophilus]SKC71633.1 N-acetylmuramoyl-L-alanine amidase [Maledivibacter halophilus]SKC80229.1 N-acetylmuramoyl-L-alanine amidase [Maledivibacter halophilus]
MKIAIDVGHGIDTYPPSKGIGDFAEFSFNNEVGKLAKEILEHNGFEVYLSQPFDSKEVPLKIRSSNINKEKCDIGFSIHADAASDEDVAGHHAFYWHTSPKGKVLALKWLKYADETLPNKSRGIRACIPRTWTDFHIVRRTNCPFILMEHGYFTNKHERENLLKSLEFQKKCALAIGKTACEYFDIEFKNPWTERWGEIYINELSQKKIIDSSHDSSEEVTWDEMAAVICRILERIERLEK